jgi:hypothetical protein
MRATILTALISILTLASMSAVQAFPVHPSVTLPTYSAHYYNDGFFFNRCHHHWGGPWGGYGWGNGWGWGHHHCHRRHHYWY